MADLFNKDNITNPSLRSLILHLVEKYRLFHLSVVQVLMAVLTPMLLAAVLILGWMYANKVKEIVTNDFNQQQLVLAQHAARQIENSLDLLKKELSLLGLSPSIQYFEKVSMGKRMGITFSSVREQGVMEIRYVESMLQQTHVTMRYIESLKQQIHHLDAGGYRIAATNPEDLLFLKWAGNVKNKGSILLGEASMISVYSKRDGKGELLAMKMAVPVWQISVDEANPVATDRFSGVLIFVIDANQLIKKITEGIKSGKTGYAWVMNENGLFLYHPEKDFVGKNAFEARKEKKPTISFARINSIQKDLMLAGKEGTSWYISGWHKGEEREMKKLIAYTPIHLNEPENRLWSIAVVAPISEVENAIHSIHVRQFSLQSLLIIILLLGGVTVISLMITWSHSLEQEVEKKTVELKKSENQYRQLIENANDIIFTVDRNSVITSINKAGCGLFKSTKEELVGQNIGEICHNESSAFMQFKAIDEVYSTGENKLIVYSVSINDSERWLSTNFSGLQDEKGNISSVLGISRDITNRKKMEEQMFHTEKLASVGTLAAGVAHEINNPLAIILGFTDLMSEKVPRDSEMYDILKTIEKHGTNAKRVVENLLSFTRVAEGKVEEVDINKNIESVIAVMKNTFSLNKISFKQNLLPGVPHVKGGAGELQQVFFNIMSNAASAMKGGGILTISTSFEEGQKVGVRISDTGCGIKKEHRTRIFDPLFTTKKVGEGTGLGLFVSYGIITKYGGTITFETRTEEESGDTGTTFIITLPALKDGPKVCV
ncbi:MAG: PAS domain S-box protein [Nitrospirae bacterium]|nr:PAS domain S-box protein [Nitrospirota bacterium]